MLKRNIYLLLGTITTLSPIIIPILKGSHVITIFLSIILTYSVFTLIGLVMTMINVMISDDNNIPDIGDIIPFMWIPLALKQKKIYYSDLGYFFITVKYNTVNTVTVHKQGYFFRTKLFDIYFRGDDVDKLRMDIKSELEVIYKKELEKKRRKNIIKNWDGYIDTVSKRDDKINQILK
jgi:hypothetical protein